MKTPMQELLKLESDLTRMFDSDLRVAMALLEHIRTNGNKMLEKEKEVFKAREEIIDIIDSENSGHSAEQRLDEIADYIKTFNTKERW